MRQRDSQSAFAKASSRQARAFTLAELLIALAILGVIATFTIPKILDSGSDSKFNSIAKEAASMFVGAYQMAKLNGEVTKDTTDVSLMKYMNYVRLDTTSLIDHVQTASSVSCAVAFCYVLHNGGYFQINGRSFNDTKITNSIRIHFDPDGKYSGTATGPGKGIQFILYYNGRLRTHGTMDPNTCDSSQCVNPTPAYDPPWFSWSN